jgi:hypothetical protein
MTSGARGTRERLYRVDGVDRVPSWVSDQVNALTEGWMPLSSERFGGWLRVTYRAVDSGRVLADPPSAVAPPPSPDHVRARSRATLVSALTMLVAILTVARL